MDNRDFDMLWGSLMAPIRELKRQVSDLSRQSSRAEVAGAVEIVSALPAAGKAGRLLFLLSDAQLYLDNGTNWVPAGSPAITTTNVWLTSATSTTSTSFVNVYGSAITHSFTRDNALISAAAAATGSSTGRAVITVQVDGVDGGTEGGVRGAVTRTAPVAVTFSNLLAASNPATIRLRVRSSNGTTVRVERDVRIVYTIMEY